MSLYFPEPYESFGQETLMLKLIYLIMQKKKKKKQI